MVSENNSRQTTANIENLPKPKHVLSPLEAMGEWQSMRSRNSNLTPLSGSGRWSISRVLAVCLVAKATRKALQATSVYEIRSFTTAFGSILLLWQSAPANAAGVAIHTACHLARSDAHAVCHAHSLYGKAWAAFGRNLDMISQDVCYFYKAHSVYDNNGGIAFAADEGSNIAQALGKNKAAILVNHGLITVGQTVDEAAYLYTLLEKSCRIQLMVEATGLPKSIAGRRGGEYISHGG
ncbi:unnamed protein product [Zymoseptoria tritici ST99CH_3D1]|nr:unnamed protein product [Zymoseptoria tritici ST99CH_3D1]